jgi:outer membrane immunogenic protein
MIAVQKIMMSPVPICLLVLLLTSAACAEEVTPLDAPEPPEKFDWTGFYVGVQGGLAFDAEDDAEPLFSLEGSEDSDDPLSPVLGGQVGYDHQFGDFVLGVEGDLEWLGDAENDSAGDTPPE